MAEPLAPWTLLSTHTGVVHLDCPPAAVFLKCSPAGAYTTTRSGNDGQSLLLWNRHLNRLAHSTEVLSLAMPDAFPRPVENVNRLQDLVMPSLQAGLQRALTMRRQRKEEVSVTILLSPSHPTWTACVHISSYLPRAPPVPPARLTILGSGRPLPLAKHSSWASSRAPLESANPWSGSELLLSKDGHGLLEGAVTNFFVVSKTPQKETTSSSTLPCPGLEVQTAPLSDGVLPGVIRQLVVEICESDHIPIREVAPSWHSRASWTEAFVTSSLRMVQPVECIRGSHPWVPSDRLALLPDCDWTELRLGGATGDGGGGGVTEHIRRRVLQRALDEGVPVTELFRNPQYGSRVPGD